jgi:hypothetical protein
MKILIRRVAALKLMYQGQIEVNVDQTLEKVLFIFSRLSMPQFIFHNSKSSDGNSSIIFFKQAIKIGEQDFAETTFKKLPAGWMDDSALVGQLDREMMLWVLDEIAEKGNGIWDL